MHQAGCHIISNFDARCHKWTTSSDQFLLERSVGDIFPTARSSTQAPSRATASSSSSSTRTTTTHTPSNKKQNKTVPPQICRRPTQHPRHERPAPSTTPKKKTDRRLPRTSAGDAAAAGDSNNNNNGRNGRGKGFLCGCHRFHRRPQGARLPVRQRFRGESRSGQAAAGAGLDGIGTGGDLRQASEFPRHSRGLKWSESADHMII